MNTYKRHRFAAEIISHAVWLYYRFNLSHRRCAGPFIEDLLAERGIIVGHASIRLWCIRFGAKYTRRLKRKHQGYGDTFFIGEVFVKINGKQGTDKLLHQYRRYRQINFLRLKDSNPWSQATTLLHFENALTQDADLHSTLTRQLH
jgi:hypothetical protein